MAKLISLFNNKGGVSKTTTTFHLGWKLASLGKKVLIVDADPQCNLTGLTLGLQNYQDLFNFYDSKKNTDIFNSLAPIFSIDSQMLGASGAITKTKNENMSILAGNIRFAEIDIQLATALTSSVTLPILRQFIGSINELIRRIASEFDIVLIDMSPSISATNQCILMSSDYFIIPTSPDFYCYQAIDSLSNVLPNWSKNIASFRKSGDKFALPKENPKMLGFMSQNYRVYTTGIAAQNDNDQKTMSKEYQSWLDKIKNVVSEKLVPALKEEKMIIDEAIFRDSVEYDAPYHLAGIQNFNSLIPVSQRLSKPIYELVQADSNWTGAVWEKTQNGKKDGVGPNIEMADTVYTNLSQSILKMLSD